MDFLVRVGDLYKNWGHQKMVREVLHILPVKSECKVEPQTPKGMGHNKKLMLHSTRRDNSTFVDAEITGLQWVPNNDFFLRWHVDSTATRLSLPSLFMPENGGKSLSTTSGHGDPCRITDIELTPFGVPCQRKEKLPSADKFSL